MTNFSLPIRKSFGAVIFLVLVFTARFANGADAPQKLRVADGQLDRFRKQQTLRRRVALLLQPRQHLLEQNPLVRRMLVEQHQSAVGFQHHIKFADHADEAEGDV